VPVKGESLIPDIVEELGWKAVNPVHEVFHDGSGAGLEGRCADSESRNET
jgi:hypothetical protein